MSKKKENHKDGNNIEIKDENNDSKETELKEEEIIENDQIETDKSDYQELEQKIQELQDTLLRKVAEFENYKRRTENDQLNLLKYAAESFILKVLPVYDDLGRSVNHIDDSNQDSLKKGLKLVYDKFTKILDEQGVKKLETEGEEFNVEYHEALMQQPSDEVPNNTVLTEIEPGYIFKDKVIKHAKVVVSQQTEKENNDSDNEQEQE